jgi:O-antigen ligase
MVHVDFQPGFTVTAGSTHAHIVLSDLAVAAVLVAAVATAVADGLGRLRYGVPAWIAIALFLGLVVVATLYPSSPDYPRSDHLVTAAKFVEYGLLAPAAVLVVRRRVDFALLVATLTASAVAATTLGVIQFLGWRIVAGWPAGYRQPSFLGHHDFAALSGAALAVGLVAIAMPGRVDRRLAWAGGIAGALGLLVSGSLAGAIGLAVASLVAAFAARRAARRAVAILAIAGAVLVGVVIFRGGDVKTFLHYVGIGHKQEQIGVESYIQRTMLVYYGLQVWRNHPFFGAGWQATNDPYVFTPLLPKLRAKYPGTPPIGFPSPEHPYGVQNAYVQALSDLGTVGLVLFLGALLTPLWLVGRRVVRGPPDEAFALPAMWLLVAMGVLTAIGIVAGIPTDALLWIAAGLCAAPALVADN